MKKILAIILSVAMLCGVLALNTFAADTTPKVTLITNEGSPVDINTDTYFTVRLDNFTSIKGMDITITAGSDLIFKSVQATGLKNELVKDTNYTITDNKIRIVDLTVKDSASVDSAKIIVMARATTDENATQNITVEGKYADSGKTLFNISTEPGVFEVSKTVNPTPVSNATLTAKDNYFIPYGSVYKETNTGFAFVAKETNGGFNVPEGDYKYKEYKIPENGITTFGVSYRQNEKHLRFGSYSNKNATDVEHGTMVFEGDWLALKEHYIKKGYTVQQILKAIYDNYDKNNPNGEFNYVFYTVKDKNGEDKKVNVYKFKQKNYMWKGQDANESVLEYAIRLTGYLSETNYTAVSYSINGEEVTLSDNVKSTTTDAF